MAAAALGLGADRRRGRSSRTGSPARARRPVLAVLPFRALGPSERRVIRRGLHREVRVAWARVRGFSHRRRGAAKYRGRPSSRAQIARELGDHSPSPARCAGRRGAGRARAREPERVVRGQAASGRNRRGAVKDVFQLQKSVAEHVGPAPPRRRTGRRRSGAGAQRRDGETSTEYEPICADSRAAQDVGPGPAARCCRGIRARRRA